MVNIQTICGSEIKHTKNRLKSGRTIRSVFMDGVSGVGRNLKSVFLGAYIYVILFLVIKVLVHRFSTQKKYGPNRI